jgi:hypothetical protein
MLNKYYYLVATLPYLRFGRGALIDKEAFLIECGKWLNQRDTKILLGASLGDIIIRPEDPSILRAWKEFDLMLRTELALARSSIKQGRNEKPGPVARVVLAEATPLLMERAIARIRWEYLDASEAGNFFDVNFLMLYFLKLQILERLKLFDKDLGAEVFQGICEVGDE